MKLDGYPGVSSFEDRHGKTRWRYKRKGRTKALPSPDDPSFEEAYLLAIEGRIPRTAKVAKFPGGVVPKSFAAAWNMVQKTDEWLLLDPQTQNKNRRLAEGFLSTPVAEGQPELWRDILVSSMRRVHVKHLLSDFADKRTKGKHTLTVLRKMIDVAMDAEWREDDPTHKIKWRIKTIGWKAWSREAMLKYESRWPIGSTPRLVYAVALWLGNRRSDVASLRKDQRCTRTVMIDGEPRQIDGFQITQKKGGKSLFLPILPMLEECLIEHDGETVIQTAYRKPFSEKSLTGAMAYWTEKAKLPPGHTLHGLRKSLGVLLAEADATTRQLMEALGHDNIEHAELYSREASQIRLAVQGMEKVVKMVGRANQSG